VWQAEFTFDGGTYESPFDRERLTGQWLRVFNVMRDGQWRTLPEIAAATGDRSEAAISARLRDFRKERFGSHTVNRRARGDRASGYFEYQLETESGKAG
jgi:hypothetical protein